MFLDDSTMSSDTKKVFLQGPSHPDYPTVFQYMLKQFSKRWGMIGYKRRRHLDTEEEEVWTITIESWNTCACSCVKGSRDGLQTFKSKRGPSGADANAGDSSNAEGEQGVVHAAAHVMIVSGDEE